MLRERKRTSVFVAHRLRTIWDSDEILVLKGGMVVERGRHEELVGRVDGVYADLWGKQEGGLVGGEEEEEEDEEEDDDDVDGDGGGEPGRLG